jgi:hypothetical protein
MHWSWQLKKPVIHKIPQVVYDDLCDLVHDRMMEDWCFKDEFDVEWGGYVLFVDVEVYRETDMRTEYEEHLEEYEIPGSRWVDVKSWDCYYEGEEVQCDFDWYKLEQELLKSE